MIHLFLNGLGASAGGGLTYLRNVLPHLSQRGDVRTTVAIGAGLRSEFEGLPNLECADVPEITGAARRFWFEQRQLPALVRKSGAQVLISAGNFALRKSPVPQILLSRNSLYTSTDFYRDLRSRGEYAMWLDTHAKAALAKRSVCWANYTVAPSQAFAAELQRWTGRKVIVIHHGFDNEAFFRDQSPLPESVQQKLQGGEDYLRLLFVSHYNYYRNFETLFRAIPLLRRRLQGRKVRLFLTCRLRDGENPGAYDTKLAAALIEQLGIRDEIVELGAVPYEVLHHVYRACDVYVTAAYTETFAHPLVEAMATGLPIVASDLPVHREVCRDAALYFPTFDHEALAQCLETLVEAKKDGSRPLQSGRRQAMEFSWPAHLQKIIDQARQLIVHAPSLGDATETHGHY
jgi:glycosyltransferase involved in cell wall biosynthesis